MLLSNQGFEADYEIRLSNGMPRDAIYKFREPTTRAAGIALQVETRDLVFDVMPSRGESWTGTFHGGAEGIDGVFATPCTDVVCIVVKGCGYWVPVLAPENYDIVQSTPIKSVIPVVPRRLMIFMSYTRLAAYGIDGLIWRTEDLSWDGLEISEVGFQSVSGVAWDAPAGHHVPFSVDLATGRADGGSSPKMYMK